MRNLALLGLVLALSGCSLLQPSLDMAKLTPQAAASTTVAPELDFISPTSLGSWAVVTPTSPADISGTAWYKLMPFTALPSLIERAYASNPTLAQAQARLKQAEAQAGLSFSTAFLPSLTGDASITRGRSAPNTGMSNPPTETRGRVGASLSWPLDVFGRLTGQATASRRLRDGAGADLEQARLLLERSVAQTYVNLLAASITQQEWATALGQAEELNRLTQLRYTAGDIPASSAQSTFATLQTLRTQALAAQRQRIELETALATLLGEAPRDLPLPTADLIALQTPALNLPSSISSTALIQRPDVRAAAAQLAAANAAIGAARAAFLPSISITGDAGYAVGQHGNLFDWSNRTWSVGPVVTLPLFQGTALRANLKNRWGQYDQAVAAYRDVVLNAYGDVRNTLTAATTTQASAQSATAAAQAQTAAATAMALRYSAGDVAKADWLNAAITAAQARANAAQVNAANHAAAAALATALGGAW